MLQGKAISLRPVGQTDLDVLYDMDVNISNRGEYLLHSLLESDPRLWHSDA